MNGRVNEWSSAIPQPNINPRWLGLGRGMSMDNWHKRLSHWLTENTRKIYVNLHHTDYIWPHIPIDDCGMQITMYQKPSRFLLYGNPKLPCDRVVLVDLLLNAAPCWIMRRLCFNKLLCSSNLPHFLRDQWAHYQEIPALSASRGVKDFMASMASSGRFCSFISTAVSFNALSILSYGINSLPERCEGASQNNARASAGSFTTSLYIAWNGSVFACAFQKPIGFAWAEAGNTLFCW